MAISEKNPQSSEAAKETFPGGERLRVEEFKKEIEKLEGYLEKEWTPEKKEEVIKQEIKSFLEKVQKTPSSAAPLKTRDEAKEIKKFPPSEQVEALVFLVFEKGLKEAIAVAKNLDNPAILDEFHDTLIDCYYKLLIEKKILKP